RDGEEQVRIGTSAGDLYAEALVGFLVDQGIGLREAEPVAIEAMRALGDFIFNGIKERAIVGGPCGGRDALDAERKGFVGLEILDLEGELAISGRIECESEEMVVVGDGR